MTASSASERLFGTDGIRGKFGQPPLDRSTVVSLGAHLARLLARRTPNPTILLGGDTRASTPELCRWLATGMRQGGGDCRFLGVLPTPGLAYLAHRLGAAAAVAVSASHNPSPDNGIKLIDGQGFKWLPADEARLEAFLAEPLDGAVPETEVELRPDRAAVEQYTRAVADTLDDATALPLDGLRLAVDCANGAASGLAGRLYASLGAEVHGIHHDPNGHNINLDCGSTHPEELLELTVDQGCDLGIAFDGDADRALFADEKGRLLDGDVVLYLWAMALQARGELEPSAIVATSMSNLGLETALTEAGIRIARCDVGDREVVRTMQEEGILLGGEQSGHIVHLGLSTTGDGLLTGLQIARLCHRAGRPVSELAAGFRRFPQILLNIPVDRKPDWTTLPAVVAAAQQVEDQLGRQGRLVLRYSGTEPLARIMIEGPDQRQITAMAEGIAAAFRQELGG